MKAAFIRKTGGPEVIEVGDLPMPQIKDDEVLVKVSAVSVNPIDTYIRSGKYNIDHKFPEPLILGKDLVGIVSKVGSNVEGFSPGQRVWSNSLGKQGQPGSFAEYVPVNMNYLYPAPEKVDDKSLVSVLLTGATASLGLIRDAMLKTTDTIFINGGGGSVAAAVIQLAKGRGAKVIVATTGKEKMEWCKSIGADIVLDYKNNKIEEMVKKEAQDGVDVFWDTSKAPNFDLGMSLLGRNGRFILMSGAESKPPFPVGSFYRKECSMKGLNLLYATEQELRQCADVINLCLERNQFKNKIAHVFPLSETAKAHSMMESQPEIWGKIVLTVP